MSVVSKFENSRCYIQLKKEQVYKKKKPSYETLGVLKKI